MQYTIAAPTNSPKSRQSHLYMIVPHEIGAQVMYAKTRAIAMEYIASRK